MHWLAVLASMLVGASALAGREQGEPVPSVQARPTAVWLNSQSQALRIDGKLDEPIWMDAPVYDAFVQYLPLDQQPAPAHYRTTVQIVVEEHALVFGVRAFDPRPEEIRAHLMRRDLVRRDQDFISIFIDPVGSRRSAQFMRISAAGVVADGTYIADTDTEDFAPDFEFESAVARLPDGYSVELRLPLLSLRYPYEGGATWRTMVARSIPREASMLLLSAPLTKDALNFIAELQEIDGLQDLVERVRKHALLSLRPELTVRHTRHADEQGSARNSKVSPALDIKWRPRADWVFDATLNPDFSQVELDVPQLAGNTRFALSLVEKRPFFLESTDVIDLPVAAFYSRSVTDPGWGLRSTWRGASADASVLSLRDDGGGLILRPGPFATDVVAQGQRSQASLLRGRLHSEDTSTGALLTRRDYADGRFNQVAGGDLTWRTGPEQQMRLRALGSWTNALFDLAGAPASGATQGGQHWFASWWRRVPGWNLTAEATRISNGFRNDNGFVDQAGVRKWQAEVIRRWGETSLPGFTVYELESYLWAREIRALDTGEVTSRQFHPGIWGVAAYNTEAWLQMRFDAERTRSGAALHSLRGLAGSYGVNPTPWFTRLLVELELGQRVDVASDRVGRGAVWLLEAKVRSALPNGWGLESEQRVQQGFINLDGQRAATDTAAQWLVVLHLDERDSLRAIWQGSRTSNAAGARRDDTMSLVFQRRSGYGRNLSIGASRRLAWPGRVSDTEVFAKASFEFDR